MRSFYFKNSSNNAQKNEIIRVAKYELQRRNACKGVVASTLVNVNVLIPPKPNPMPTRHRPPTSTYQNENIERVSNRDLQKWKACQERRCRNVNKQERY